MVMLGFQATHQLLITGFPDNELMYPPAAIYFTDILSSAPDTVSADQSLVVLVHMSSC